MRSPWLACQRSGRTNANGAVDSVFCWWWWCRWRPCQGGGRLPGASKSTAGPGSKKRLLLRKSRRCAPTPKTETPLASLWMSIARGVLGIITYSLAIWCMRFYCRPPPSLAHTAALHSLPAHAVHRPCWCASTSRSGAMSSKTVISIGEALYGAWMVVQARVLPRGLGQGWCSSSWVSTGGSTWLGAQA